MVSGNKNYYNFVIITIVLMVVAGSMGWVVGQAQGIAFCAELGIKVIDHYGLTPDRDVFIDILYKIERAFEGQVEAYLT